MLLLASPLWCTLLLLLTVILEHVAPTVGEPTTPCESPPLQPCAALESSASPSRATPQEYALSLPRGHCALQVKTKHMSNKT
jgi:hypothetical protein